MENGLNEEILDKLTKVCLCKAIPRKRMKDAIRAGADTVDKVNREVGSGSGGCGGRRCGPKIDALIEGYRNGEWV
jgi:bacterioferritin-associated ferredoxin